MLAPDRCHRSRQGSGFPQGFTMGLETLFSMGGVLLLLGTLGVWSGARHRLRGRLFGRQAVPLWPTPVEQP